MSECGKRAGGGKKEEEDDGRDAQNGSFWDDLAATWPSKAGPTGDQLITPTAMASSV